jgi:PAS domain S-box-containing protein
MTAPQPEQFPDRVQRSDARLTELEFENRKLRKALYHSESRYHALFDMAAVGMAVTSIPDGRFIAVNPKLVEITGYTEKELTTLSFFDLTHPDDRTINDNIYADLIEGRTPFFKFEKRYICKSGEIIWVHATASTIKEPAGVPRSAIAIIEDVTERHKAQQRLRESERLYRAIGESIPYGIWVCDAIGGHVYASESILNLVGVTQEEFRESFWSRAIHPEDAKRLFPAWQECLQTGSIWDAECRFIGADGRYHPVLVRGVPVRDDNGRIINWAGINLDIAALKLAEEELRQANEALMRANTDLEQFAYAASHDLQEPLRTVTSYVRLLERRYGNRLGEEGLELMSFVVSGATRMQALIRDLLSYSRILHNPNAPEDTFHPVSIANILDNVIADLHSAMSELHVSITHDELPTVQGDVTQLSQLFQNLLSNSIKYRRTDVPVKIYISAERNIGEWQFRVTDNGIGFSTRYAERIFGLFKRLHGVELPGTGIGLAICRKIVERHGGWIWAEGRPNEGATFAFTLPAEPDSRPH